MFRRRTIPSLFILAVILGCGFLLGQTPDTATLSGRITDLSGAAIPGVEVTATNSVTGFKRTAQTDAAGAFSFAGLSISGAYRLTAKKEAFAERTVSDINLAAGTAAEVSLELAVSGTQTKVTVTGEAGGVRTDGPELGAALGQQQIEATPLINRRITYLPLLNSANRPAINQGDVFMNQDLFTTNGTGRRQAWFEVDGANAIDAWGRQTIIPNFGADTVQEMDVLTSAFSAQYGYTAGSVINIVTQRGENQFHGSVLALGRPSDTEARLSGFTTANATSGNQITNDTLGQFSAALSGPVGSGGKTQFFAQSEYSWQSRTSPVTSPIAPENFLGHYQDWLGMIRLDHEFSGRNNAFFRGNLDRFFDTNPNGIVGGNSLPNVDRVFNKHVYDLLAGDTAVLSPTLINNLRLQFQLASPITQFIPVIDSTQFVVPVSSGGTFTSGTSQSALLMNRQYEANDVVSAQRSRHNITFGGDVIEAHNGGNSKEFGGPLYLGSFTYNTCTLSLSVCESSTYLDNIANVASYTQSYGNAQYTVDDALWSLFVQDDYKVRSDLTLNLGLRYERQTFTDFDRGFAPRFGFAYNVKGAGKTVVRGGFGIYYSQIVDNNAANYALSGVTGVFNYTAGPGQVGFPSSIAAAPLPAFPPGAVAPVLSLYVRPGESSSLNQYFPTSTLLGYQNALLSPYTEQWTLGVQRQLKQGWVLSVDYVGSHTLRINRPLDVDPPTSFVRTAQGQTRSAQAANCTRPYWVYWYAQEGMTCNTTKATNPQPAYSVIQSDVNDGFAKYNALDASLSRNFSHGVSMLASYTWSHAIDNVDPDIPSQNPNDPRMTGAAEIGNAIFDQRNRFVLSGVYTAPLAIRLGGVGSMASGLPYNITTGSTNGGDTGAETDRPVINGAVIARNAGQGRPIYDFAPFVERAFNLHKEGLSLNARAEAFNVFNHANFVGYSSTYGNGTTSGVGFGQPASGITNQLPAREMQFSVELLF